MPSESDSSIGNNLRNDSEGGPWNYPQTLIDYTDSVLVNGGDAGYKRAGELLTEYDTASQEGKLKILDRLSGRDSARYIQEDIICSQSVARHDPHTDHPRLW